jgi:hypothetical protein
MDMRPYSAEPSGRCVLRGRGGHEQVIRSMLISGLPGDVVGAKPCPGWLVRLALDLDVKEGR